MVLAASETRASFTCRQTKEDCRARWRDVSATGPELALKSGPRGTQETTQPCPLCLHVFSLVAAMHQVLGLKRRRNPVRSAYTSSLQSDLNSHDLAGLLLLHHPHQHRHRRQPAGRPAAVGLVGQHGQHAQRRPGLACRGGSIHTLRRGAAGMRSAVSTSLQRWPKSVPLLSSGHVRGRRGKGAGRSGWMGRRGRRRRTDEERRRHVKAAAPGQQHAVGSDLQKAETVGLTRTLAKRDDGRVTRQWFEPANANTFSGCVSGCASGCVI